MGRTGNSRSEWLYGTTTFDPGVTSAWSESTNWQKSSTLPSKAEPTCCALTPPRMAPHASLVPERRPMSWRSRYWVKLETPV